MVYQAEGPDGLIQNKNQLSDLPNAMKQEVIEKALDIISK